MGQVEDAGAGPAAPPAGGRASARLGALDGLRGVGALLVLFDHFILAYPGGQEDRAALAARGFAAPNAWFYLTPLRALYEGYGCVLMFFVLSGFALGLSFIHVDRQRYAPYAIKRLLRIYPPFAVALLVAAGLSLVLGWGPIAGMTQWTNDVWTKPVTARVVADHLLMRGETELNPPMWTLVHEFRISFVFPFLVWLTLWSWRASLAATLAAGLLATLGVAALSGHVQVAAALQSVQFLFLFSAGVCLAIHLGAVQAWLARLSRRGHVLLWVAALLLMAFFPDEGDYIDDPVTDLLLMSCGAGAVLAIALCLGDSAFTRWLKTRVPQFVGKISFSLYLLHIVAMQFVLRLTPGWPLTLKLVVVLAASLLGGACMYRFVEAPTIRLGRRLAAGAMRRPGDATRPQPAGIR